MNLKLYLFIIIYVVSTYVNASEKKNVLILNSYHRGLQWTDEINKGIIQGLDEFDIDKEIFIEYLDSKRFFNATDYIQTIKKFYQEKYKNTKLDVILLSDDFALRFLLQHRDSIFGEVPVIFCGINNIHTYPDTYTGILEDIDYIANFKLIQKLHPDYSKIYFIVDNTETGNVIYNRAYRMYLPIESDYRYEFVTQYSFNELYEKIRNLDNKAVIFITAFTKDRNNIYCSYDKIIENIRKNTDLPIYGAWNFYLGKGIVGGKLIDAYEQGYRTAVIATRVLSGENIKTLGIEKSVSQYFFDFKELKGKGIKKKNLPEDSIVINDPKSLLKENKQQFIFFGIILILLLAIIVVLWGFLLFRRKKMKEEVNYSKKLELKNEELLVIKDKMEEANRLKSAFLANMSHEIRTPMNGIIGFSKLLADSPNIDAETRQNYLNLINKSGYILLDLINDVIDLSKLESNQLKVCYNNCKIIDVLEELFDFFNSEKKSLKKAHIKIILGQKEKIKDVSLFTDCNRVRQVLYNLLNNAFKFTENGEIKFGCYPEDKDLVFYVSDTGIGLSEHEKEIIFERFRQVDDKTTRRYGGSGLGLSISKGIVERLKGKMWVESQLSKGSTFYFSIPYIKVKNNDKSQDENVEMQKFYWPGKTILIVEDSLISYELLTKFLADTKIGIIHASDGQKAVELCRDIDQIDLILMDIQLPVLDGLEATNIIKSFKKDIPIIAQTANAMDEDRDNIISAGCDDYIAKPINRLELLQKIDFFFS